MIYYQKEKDLQIMKFTQKDNYKFYDLVKIINHKKEYLFQLDVHFMKLN